MFEESAAQLDTNGFAVVKHFASHSDCDALYAAGVKLAADFDVSQHPMAKFGTGDTQTNDSYFMNSGDCIRYFFEPKAFEDDKLVVPKERALNKIGHALHVLHPLYRKVTEDVRVAAIAHAVGIKKPVVPQSMVIFKHPHIGGPVAEHQDATFLYTSPPSCLGFWLALHDVTLTNGCLYAIPGSHKGASEPARRFVRVHDATTDNTTLEFTAPLPQYDDSAYVPICVSKGDLVLIHALLVHKSGLNTSDASRDVYAFHVVDGAAQYPSTNWLQPTESTPFLPLSQT